MGQKKKREMQNYPIWGCFPRVRRLEDQGIKDIENLQFKMVKYETILNELATEDKELAVINKVVIN